MAEQSTKCVCLVVGAVLGLGLLLTIILVPMSFSSLEYYEYGFARRKSTGAVNTKTVYSGGKHMLGPDYEFKIFRADAHFEFLTNVAVFTKDKLETSLDVSFQYFLRQEDLPHLHRQYDVHYEGVMRSSAIDALKGEAPSFTTREYISRREDVEAAMYKAVRERLGGKCCNKNCKAFEYACDVGCKPASTCNSQSDKGLFVDVRHFQLGSIYIPGDVKDRFLRALTLQEDSARELLLQEAQVIRKNTEAHVRKIRNEALEISQNATAQSSLVTKRSEAGYTAAMVTARSRGLRILYSRLNLTDQAFKSSFDYLRTLSNTDNIHLTVDFQQAIVGNFGTG